MTDSDRNFSLKRIIDNSIEPKKRIRQRDDNYTKYSPNKNRNIYYYNSYRRSISWDRNKSKYIFNSSGPSRNGDKNGRYRISTSPPYRSMRCRRRSRSYSRSCSHKRSPNHSHKHSPRHSRNYSSPKQSLNERDFSTRKKHFSPDSPPHKVEKLLDNVKCPDNQKGKSPAPESPPLFNSQPPLPKSPPPPKPPPPPVENYSGIPPPPITINHSPNVDLLHKSPHLWVNQEDPHLQHFYAFQNPPMPRVSVNNLPLVPGVGNLPVHITPVGEQILHDMEGSPIPVGPSGHLLPVDMSGRLEYMFSNQAVPIFMSEDRVLRLPNGEPVPNNDPNQLPVNIDGSIIPIGPDSRPLYQSSNTPQVGSLPIPSIDPIGSQQEIHKNPPLHTVININRDEKTNVIPNELFNEVKPSVTVIEIQPDLEFKNKQISLENLEIEMKSSSKEGLEISICEEPSATNTHSSGDFEKPNGTAITECSVEMLKENNKIIKKQLYENVDLNKLVEKFLNRVSSRKIRTIYKKKFEGNLIERKRLETKACVAKENLGTIHRCDGNLEKESPCTIQSENYFMSLDENLWGSKKDYRLSDEEAFDEKIFIETINEAISLFAEIDFNPPALGRFLFSKSSTYSVNESHPNASPLLKNKVKLPFLSPENLDSPPKEKKSREVNFRFLPEKNGKLLDKTTVRLDSAVQCDFTSIKFKNLCAKIDILKKKLSERENENVELKKLYKSIQEENKKKAEELNKIMIIIEEKNRLIEDLTQPRRQYWK